MFAIHQPLKKFPPSLKILHPQNSMCRESARTSPRCMHFLKVDLNTACTYYIFV